MFIIKQAVLLNSLELLFQVCSLTYAVSWLLTRESRGCMIKSELNDENSEVNSTLECVTTEAPDILEIHFMQSELLEPLWELWYSEGTVGSFSSYLCHVFQLWSSAYFFALSTEGIRPPAFSNSSPKSRVSPGGIGQNLGRDCSQGHEQFGQDSGADTGSQRLRQRAEPFFLFFYFTINFFFF